MALVSNGSNVGQMEQNSSYKNQLDIINLSVYSALISVASVTLNGIFIYLVNKHKRFQKANMFIRVAYATVDLSFGLISSVHYLIYLNVDATPEWVICIGGNIAIALFFSTLEFTAYIALERYCFFCKPHSYQRYFNARSIAITSVSIIAITQTYVHVKYATTERIFQPLYGMCISPDQSFHNRMNMAVFILPAAICTCFSIYKIQMTIRRISNRRTRQSTLNETENNLTDSKAMKEELKRGLRLILLVSGTFWSTYLPAFLVRTVIIQMGYSTESLNSYEYPLVSRIVRYSFFSFALSAVFDPLVNFAMSKDLRVAFKRMFGLNANFSKH